MQILKDAFQRKNYNEIQKQLYEVFGYSEDELVGRQIEITKLFLQYISELHLLLNLEQASSIMAIFGMVVQKSLQQGIKIETLQRFFINHTVLGRYQALRPLHEMIAHYFVEYSLDLCGKDQDALCREYLSAASTLLPVPRNIEKINAVLVKNISSEAKVQTRVRDNAIVIPIYREMMTEYERISLVQCRRVFGNYDIIYAAPGGLHIHEYVQLLPNAKVLSFPDEFFGSIESYNCLMLSSEFYEKFAAYTYILLYQLDAFVFADELEYFCGLGYDYIGAPWGAGRHVRVGPQKSDKVSCYVGNGGLSLRHVQHSLEMLAFLGDKVSAWGGNEDIFWSFCGEVYKDKFRVAPVEIAERFAFEETPRQSYEKLGRLPFGCHAWEKYDIEFVRSVFKEYGYYI